MGPNAKLITVAALIGILVTAIVWDQRETQRAFVQEQEAGGWLQEKPAGSPAVPSPAPSLSVRLDETGPPSTPLDVAQAAPTPEPVPEPVPEPTVAVEPPAAAQPKPPRLYQVKEGDSFWSIAILFYGNGALWPRIAQANVAGFDPARQEAPALAQGKSLVIPDAPETPSAPSSAPSATANQPNRYTVQEGDRYWAIATKVWGNGALWPRIAAANASGPIDPDQPPALMPGQVLLIPER